MTMNTTPEQPATLQSEGQNFTKPEMSREAFEAWLRELYKARGWIEPLFEHWGETDSYAHSRTQSAWEGWQAARLSAPTPDHSEHVLDMVSGDEVERVANALLDEVARQPGHAYLDDPLTMVELDGQFSFIDLARTAIAALRTSKMDVGNNS